MIDKSVWRRNALDMLFFLLLFVLTAVIFALILSTKGNEEDGPTIVGGIFIGEVTDGGWNEAHYDGLSKACMDLGHPLEIVENVEETQEACQKAVDRLAEKGCQVIFLTSDGFGSNVEDVIKAYPQIVFYTISPEAEESNATTYYGRLYQARYLAGMAAGMMTRNNVLGFVAAMDNAQVARDVNAFMLGARSVNPDVKLVVRFTGSWFNTAAEHKAAMKLIEKDHADLLAYHTSTSETVGVADEKGVYSIGYNMMEKSYSQLYLGAVVFHWEILYRSILQDFARGSVRGTGYYWWGVSEGAVSWEKESDLLGDDIIQRIEEERKGFDEGNDVFMGEIRRNDGRVMCRKKERMSDDALLRNMNWFVEGVEIEED